MQTITIRRLGPDDLDILGNVAPDVFDNAVDPELAAAYLAAPHMALWLALECDLVVGMASALIYWHPDKPKDGWVNEVGVSPKWQRRGIASRLMAEIFAWAKEEGLNSLWLATEGDNLPAQALYRSCGGNEAKDIHVYDWSPSGSVKDDDVAPGGS